MLFIYLAILILLERMAKAARAVGNAKKIVFYYDVVCPFAYMTSTVMEDLGKRAGATVEWTPVLLGAHPV